MTSTAAELLGLGASIGTVAPGQRADLLIVEGDPASDLRRLRNPRYVLQDGRIIETGSHDQLMRARGLYARLYRLNYASFDDVRDELLASTSGRS